MCFCVSAAPSDASEEYRRQADGRRSTAT